MGKRDRYTNGRWHHGPSQQKTTSLPRIPRGRRGYTSTYETKVSSRQVTTTEVNDVNLMMLAIRLWVFIIPLLVCNKLVENGVVDGWLYLLLIPIYKLYYKIIRWGIFRIWRNS